MRTRSPTTARGMAAGRQPRPLSVAEQTQRRSIILTLLRHARYRSKRDGIPFNLTVDDIKWPTNDRCPLLGIPLVPRRGKGPGSWANSPSIDRVIPSAGYIAGNVHIVSARSNTLKNSATLDELIRLGRWAGKCRLRERRALG